MKLLIVESPAKAKTISKYLDDKYTVKASVGHIRDLPKSNKKAIDIEGGFIPHYEISPGKEKVIEEIIHLSKKADEVLLATDPDREGEAIAWHIAEAAKLKNPKRVVFHEITKDAVIEAMKHPRKIDENLRMAQEARRVLDRLVGYDLSGLIWKKVRYGLSAGRVQSPALRIIMEREREIRAFISHAFWVITADTETVSKPATALALTCSEEPTDFKEVERIIKLGKERFPGLLYYGHNSISHKDCLEVHILDFNKNIYGKKITAITQYFLRPAKKFKTQKALIAQIKKDLKMAQRLTKG